MMVLPVPHRVAALLHGRGRIPSFADGGLAARHAAHSRLAALTFCILLDYCGTHRLYVDKPLSGLGMFFITATSFCGLYDRKTTRLLAASCSSG